MALRSLVIVAALAAVPQLALAQNPEPRTSEPRVDPRWAPYIGCWQLRMENTNDGIADLVAAAMRQAPPNQKAGDVMICITPSEQPLAVMQQTVLDGESVLDELVSTDGVGRSAEEASCRSTRRAEWSASGRQLFSRGTISCEGQPERQITGLSMIVPGPTWVDVQMSEVRGQRSVRVRRYGLSREQIRSGGARALNPQSPAPLSRWTLDEVKDASRKTAPEVLQAALVEAGTKFPLSGRTLVDLKKAGVADTVVDVMVALTFPEKFVIERPTYTASYGGGGGGGGYDPWSLASEYGWLSVYAPFGYQYYGYYDPRYGPGYGWVPVAPPIGGGEVEPESNGRVINGAGYTRVRPREAEPTRVNAYDGGGVVDRSGSGSSGGSGGSGGSNSGGGVSTGGYSSGGASGASGGSDGARTAVPRPPGGDQ
jgi:hypothetical protein